jgi:tetratricopeptide (TPR) repeat protein
VQGRLERLELVARRVLRAAAVFGTRFWSGGVAALLGGATREASARAWIDELVERELISRVPGSRFGGVDELTFRHAMVCEAAYGMLTDNDRALGHRLAGEWLEARGEPEPVVLAEHFERGGEPMRAAAWFRAAAEQALAAGDFHTAAQRAERGVACGADGETLGELRRAQAEAHGWLGELSLANRYALAALELLPTSTVAWFGAAGEAAETSGKLGDVAQLERIAALFAQADASVSTELAPRVTAMARCAFQLFNHGKVALAEALADRLDRVASEVQDPRVQARIHQTHSSRAMFAGDSGAYVVSEKAAALAFEQAGDLRYACMQHGHVGYAYLEIGAYRDADLWLRRALEGAARMGLHQVAATAKHNLGRVLLLLGHTDEALAYESEALEAFIAQGDQRLEAAARWYLADIVAARGDLIEAEALLRAALPIGSAAMRPVILAALARTLLAQGRAPDALVSAREAYELLEMLGGVEEGESLVRLMFAETARCGGDDATAVIDRARFRLLARAEKITDPAWRASFLEKIPENARTLELASELLADR